MTYKQIVHKIIGEPAYAKEIADLVLRARKKDQAAIDDLERRFEPLPDELEDIGLSKKALDMLSCAKGEREIFGTDPTRWMLIDFAAMLP